MTHTTDAQVDELARAARAAFAVTKQADGATRAAWLRAVADALDARTDELVALADEETNLGAGRLTGEVARTTGQLRLFAEVVEDGAYLEVTIDHAVPTATPPRPDLRRMLVPLGPVAVYSASNFPFAFSVAGGDTASALAMGCPVVVKAHSGHPKLSALTAAIVVDALVLAGAPDGTFALVTGRQAGITLVEHPDIAAAAFTGSLGGGRALFDRAAARRVPIPFYGELASINPVVVTPAADASRGADLAAGLAGSFQLGQGQFCTKPGLVFVPEGSALEAALPDHVGTATQLLLNDSILSSFTQGIAELDGIEGVEHVAGSHEVVDGVPQPRVVAVHMDTLEAHSDRLLDEVFGPVTVLVRCDDQARILRVLERLDGSLTGTIHAEPGEDVAELVDVLSARSGRVLFDGWPTGVAVNWAQQHGGPYPATTSIHTSVGATAGRRFQRPVAYQDAPASALPSSLHDDNPLGLPRRVNGKLELR